MITGKPLSRAMRERILRLAPRPISGVHEVSQDLLDLGHLLVREGYLYGDSFVSDFLEDLRALGVWGDGIILWDSDLE